MIISIRISKEAITGEEVSYILSELQFKVRDWPGASPFRIVLHGFDGKPVGECVAQHTRKKAAAERSECIRCGDPLDGGAKTLCLQCREEISAAQGAGGIKI